MSTITELGQIGTIDIPQTFHGSVLGHGDGRELTISVPVFGFRLDDEEGSIIWSEPANDWKNYWQKDEAFFEEVDRRVAAHNDDGSDAAWAWFRNLSGSAQHGVYLNAFGELPKPPISDWEVRSMYRAQKSN